MTDVIQVLATQCDAVADAALAAGIRNYGVQLQFCPPSAPVLVQQLRSGRYSAVVVQTPLQDLRRSALTNWFSMQSSGDHALLPGLQPLFLAILPGPDDKKQQRLLESGYAAVLQLPCSEYRLAKTILDLVGPAQTAYMEKEDSLRLYFGGILLELGVPGNLKGFACLCESLVSLAAQPDALFQATKVLYPQVAHRLNTSASNLERSQRTALEHMLQYGDRQAMAKYLSPCFGQGPRPCVSVTRLLGDLLQYAKMDIGGRQKRNGTDMHY